MSTNAQTTSNELMLPNGEFNPMAYKNDFAEKLKKLKALFPPDKYNLVMGSQFFMNSLPEGISLKHQIVEVNDEDLWDEKNAAKVGLCDGMVMLSMQKVINIGQAMGIRLEKVLEEEITLGKIPHLRIQYVAYLRLPDGSEVRSTPVGKTDKIFTEGTKTKAHIFEQLDQKAKRNALKELLGIPTQMKRAEAKKLWVCVRAVFKDSSFDSQRQMKTIEASATAATNALYGETAPPVQNEVKPITAEEFKEMIKNCKTLSDWEAVRDTLAKDLFPDEIIFEGLKALLGKKYRESFAQAGEGKL